MLPADGSDFAKIKQLFWRELVTAVASGPEQPDVASWHWFSPLVSSMFSVLFRMRISWRIKCRSYENLKLVPTRPLNNISRQLFDSGGCGWSMVGLQSLQISAKLPKTCSHRIVFIFGFEFRRLLRYTARTQLHISTCFGESIDDSRDEECRTVKTDRAISSLENVIGCLHWMILK